MRNFPPLRAARFQQIEPGDLFICLNGAERWYALKTQNPPNDDENAMVLLGPTFIQGLNESFLIGWQSMTVVSLGKNFSVLPSLEPASWSVDGPTRDPVCLALADDRMYICTNGSRSPAQFFPYFVEIATGAVSERRPPGITAFTNSWEIAVLDPALPPLSVLKYPLLRSG